MRVRCAVLLLALAACESAPPDPPDLAARLSFDLGPALDLPVPYGLDGNFLALPDQTGTLVFNITDEQGRLLPSRVTFRPPPGSGFADSLTDPSIRGRPGGPPGAQTGATVGLGVVGSPEGVLLQTGYGEVQVPPGSYHLVVNRGPEYETVEVTVPVAVGARQGVNVELQRSVDTRGWLAADMHIHTGRSFDSRLPIDRRAISMVTNGIEVMVPTEHHGSYDFRQLLVELGYDREVAGSVAGNELNFKEGHAGVYPVPYDPLAEAGGSPLYQDLNPQGQCDAPVFGTNCYTAVEAFPIMRALHPQGSLVTVNHPWFGAADLGYFTNVGWGYGTGATTLTPLPAAGLFDAIEILNGYWAEPDAFSYLFGDWLLLLGQGLRVAALGNSDTHGMIYVRSGWPRSWLRLPTDAPGDITEDMLRDAIRNQRVIASTGPFVTLEMEGGQIGDTIVPRNREEIHATIVADAPTWMSLDEVIVFVNGRERAHYNVPADQRPRFSADVSFRLHGDAFVVVLAAGRRPLPPDITGEQSFEVGQRTFPWAVTNPIYVDADGDGRLSFDGPSFGLLPWIPPPEAYPPFEDELPAPGTQRLRSGSTRGYGASRPAGRDCDRRPPEHPPLDAMTDLHRALPLLY